MAKKLLVADDSLTIQKVIKLALSGDGYEIQTVSDGTECLQQVALFRPDVVLIDIGLPGRSAFDLKKAANEDPDMSQIPFVLMSSAFEKVDEAKVALLRFDGRLTKPFDPSNLKSVLTAALQMSSGQTIKEFSPPAAPNMGGFSLEPSEKSRQVARPISSDNEVTGEISLLEPNLIQSDPNLSAPSTARPPSPPTNDSLWSDSPASDSSPSDFDSAEIRNLTESTVKMSGLDDLGGWNIEENAKTSLPPIPEMFTNTGMSQPDFQTSNFDHGVIPMETDHSLNIEIGSPTPNTGSFSSPLSSGSESAAPSVSEESIEALIEKKVHEQLEILVQGAVKTQLEQMAKKALPDIAERIVKAEIRKMLEGLASSND
jgi:two-component system, cell cycle response regulator